MIQHQLSNRRRSPGVGLDVDRKKVPIILKRVTSISFAIERSVSVIALVSTRLSETTMPSQRQPFLAGQTTSTSRLWDGRDVAQDARARQEAPGSACEGMQTS